MQLPASAVLIASGYEFSAVLLADSTVWTCGRNFTGVLGNGTTADSNVPVQASTPSGIVDLEAGDAFCLARRNDGSAWSWGWNGTGQLGNGNVQDRSVPGPVLPLCGQGTAEGAYNLDQRMIQVQLDPAGEHLTVSMEGQRFDLRLIDMQGRNAQVAGTTAGQAVLDLSALPTAVYAVVARTPDGMTQVKRFMKP